MDDDQNEYDDGDGADVNEDDQIMVQIVNVMMI